MNNSAQYYDVLVVGAGTAGICAALASARQGRKTVLMEEKAFPGGTAVNCQHQYICGLYHQSERQPAATLNPGISREITSFFEHAPRRIGRVFVHPFDCGRFAKIADEILQKQANLATVYQAAAIWTQQSANRITKVGVQQKQGVQTIQPGAVIDCSGQGAVLRASSACFDLTEPGSRQLAGFTVQLRDLDSPDEMTPLEVPYILNKAVKNARLPSHFRFTKFLPSESAGEGFLKINVPDSLTDQDRELRTQALEAQRILCWEHRVFKHSRVKRMSPLVSNREAPRMAGQYTLDRQDILNAGKFDDAACKCAWPIELWEPDRGPTYQYLPEEEYYEIPKRCLQSRDIENLFAAGLLISTTREAQGSTRVMGGCMATGEQAGLLACDYLDATSST
ncbi:MAG: FAD-dependent oxidoreductase [Thermodesulfobacteriota bacterium]